MNNNPHIPNTHKKPFFNLDMLNAINAGVAKVKSIVSPTIMALAGILLFVIMSWKIPHPTYCSFWKWWAAQRAMLEHQHTLGIVGSQCKTISSNCFYQTTEIRLQINVWVWSLHQISRSICQYLYLSITLGWRHCIHEVPNMLCANFSHNSGGINRWYCRFKNSRYIAEKPLITHNTLISHTEGYHGVQTTRGVVSCSSWNDVVLEHNKNCIGLLWWEYK